MSLPASMQASTTASKQAFRFEGFDSPNGTIVPDDFFDLLAPELSEAELRVCLYIIRRTFGFKKRSDDISLRQMVGGIRTKDGRVLDHGAGVVKSSAAKAVGGLVDKGVVVALRNSSPERGDEPTTYMLRFKDTDVSAGGGKERGVSAKRTRGVRQEDRGVSAKRTHKKQYLQETASSKEERISTVKPSRAETPYLDEVMKELSGALGDAEHVASNCAQARNLLASSRLSEQQLVARMYEALSVTKDRAKSTPLGAKAAYFFAVLRDLITPQPTPSGEAGISAVTAPPGGVKGGPANVPEPEPPARPVKTKSHAPGRSIPGTALKTTDAWVQVLRLLSGEIGAAALRGYFAHTELRDVCEGKAVVVAANGFIAEQLDQRFRTSVVAALTSVIGRDISVSFEPASFVTPSRTRASSRRVREPHGRFDEGIRARQTPSQRRKLEPVGERSSLSQT